MRSVVSAVAILLALACVLVPAKRARADLDISSVDTPVTIDFDTTVTEVNNGQWAGTGFQSAATAGQLDSDSWASTGMSDGALAFGGTRTTAGTDYTRGMTAVPVTTGGFYSYTVALGNQALWIQPTGSDFVAPGTITLRIKNSTGSTVNFWDVSYNLYNDNNQGRSNSFNFSYSTNDSTYTAVTALDFTSPAAADLAGPTSFSEVDNDFNAGCRWRPTLHPLVRRGRRWFG